MKKKKISVIHSHHLLHSTKRPKQFTKLVMKRFLLSLSFL